MSRPTRRQIEKRIERLEEETFSSHSATVLVTFAPGVLRREDRESVEGLPEDLVEDYKEALLREKDALGWDSGIPVLTLEDVDDFRNRLSSSLEDLEADTDVTIDERAFIQYLAGRSRGDVPAGEAGVDEQLGEQVNPDHVNRVWREMLHATVRSG